MTATDKALGFGKDSADIDPTGRSSIAAVARALTGTEAVRVVGHTSTEGDEEYNRSLSERRAHAVADVLRPDLPGASFEVIGAGETEPLVIPDDDEAGRAANRRVVITATVETEVCR